MNKQSVLVKAVARANVTEIHPDKPETTAALVLSNYNTWVKWTVTYSSIKDDDAAALKSSELEPEDQRQAKLAKVIAVTEKRKKQEVKAE
ncbi:MAG: hypothetical protein Q9208_003611 [Pyrenodesmia sp. 3 TL-2023]